MRPPSVLPGGTGSGRIDGSIVDVMRWAVSMSRSVSTATTVVFAARAHSASLNELRSKGRTEITAADVADNSAGAVGQRCQVRAADAKEEHQQRKWHSAVARSRERVVGSATCAFAETRRTRTAAGGPQRGEATAPRGSAPASRLMVLVVLVVVQTQ